MPENNENVVTLRSTHKGLVDRYVKDAFWAAVFATGADKLYNWAQSIVVDVEASGIMDYFRNRWDYDTSGGQDMGLCFLPILAAVAACVSAGFVCDMVGNLYRARQVNVVDKEKGEITETRYDFPASKEVQDIRFDRVIGTEVSQSTIDRILNTGDLRIKGVNYTNADSREFDWTIPNINDPHGAKERVLAGLPKYAGLEIRMKE